MSLQKQFKKLFVFEKLPKIPFSYIMKILNYSNFDKKNGFKIKNALKRDINFKLNVTAIKINLDNA